jgi:hypothetical protein
MSSLRREDLRRALQPGSSTLNGGDNEAKHPRSRGLSQQKVRLNATDPDRDPPGSEMNNAGTTIRRIPASVCAL